MVVRHRHALESGQGGSAQGRERQYVGGVSEMWSVKWEVENVIGGLVAFCEVNDSSVKNEL